MNDRKKGLRGQRTNYTCDSTNIKIKQSLKIYLKCNANETANGSSQRDEDHQEYDEKHFPRMSPN